MPYVADTYSLPAGTVAVSNATANSTHVNSRFSDLESAQNAVRPVVAGGTGVASLAELITALQALGWAFSDDVDLSGATVTGLYDRAADQATTSGTTFDFTGIPTWANEVRIMLNRCSPDADGGFLAIQIGAGSLVTTGYFARAEVGDGSTGVTPTTSFPVASVQAANTCTGTMTLTRSNSNVWLAEGHFQVAGNVWHSTGILALSGDLDRVRLLHSGGAAFDQGAVAVSWRA